MKKVYFVRHGRTEGNEGGIYQHPDIPLSAEGFEQAQAIARRFENIHVDTIISSPMTRAHQTAQAISDRIGVPIRETNELFQEILRPSVVRGKSQKLPDVLAVMDETRARMNDPEWHHSDEENYTDLNRRAKEAVEFLLKQKEETVLVVTHGFILKAMLGYIVLGDKMTPEFLANFQKRFHVSNTGVTVCDVFEGNLGIHTWNDNTHLP